MFSSVILFLNLLTGRIGTCICTIVTVRITNLKRSILNAFQLVGLKLASDWRHLTSVSVECH